MEKPTSKVIRDGLATQVVSWSPPLIGVEPDDVVATLEKLHALVGKGILSQAEFDAKKAELLKKLS